MSTAPNWYRTAVMRMCQIVHVHHVYRYINLCKHACDYASVERDRAPDIKLEGLNK